MEKTDPDDLRVALLRTQAELLKLIVRVEALEAQQRQETNRHDVDAKKLRGEARECESQIQARV